MSKKETINIFISHHGEDAEYLPKLRSELEKKGYGVRDSSIDERNPNNAKNPEYIKTLLRPKIDWAGTVIVLIGSETHTSDWVNWEIEHSGEAGNKRIVGVTLPGANDADIPESLKTYGNALVSWNSAKLEAAIDGEDVWLDDKDKPRPQIWDLKGIKCY